MTKNPKYFFPVLWNLYRYFLNRFIFRMRDICVKSRTFVTLKFSKKNYKNVNLHDWCRLNSVDSATEYVRSATTDRVSTPVSGGDQDFENQCGTCDPSLDPRIVGGSEARIGQFPWIARLGYVEGMRSFVGDHRALAVRLINTRSTAAIKRPGSSLQLLEPWNCAVTWNNCHENALQRECEWLLGAINLYNCTFLALFEQQKCP